MPDEDPWLTLAEIAEELRVNPATVRQWVSKGQLVASRAGLRKWIVRRSDLDAMLRRVNAREEPVPAMEGIEAVTDAPVVGRPTQEAAGGAPAASPARPIDDPNHAVALVGIASDGFDGALARSARAVPSAGYLDRLRDLAEASQHMADTLLNAANTAGVQWVPRSGFMVNGPPWELRAEGNRLGSDELWARFDSALTHVQIAVTGTDLSAVAHGFREMSKGLHEVADALEDDGVERALSRPGG